MAVDMDRLENEFLDAIENNNLKQFQFLLSK